MSSHETIVCKPTPWFLLRAAVILGMFGVFAGLFYLDGSTGYRKKNLVYFLHASFRQANDEFTRMKGSGLLTPEVWRRHAERQSVRFPEDRSILPADLALPMPWPELLHDYERMESLQWHKLWLDYSKSQGLAGNAPEKPYDARTIREQWVVFWFCLGLALAAAFVLVRTTRRSIRADADGVRGANGRFVRYGEMKRIDLRKWDTKGLAFIDHGSSAGGGTLRIDGLTYGGFKKEQGEPAERLMRAIRARFSGEILEYVNQSDAATGDTESRDAGGAS